MARSRKCALVPLVMVAAMTVGSNIALAGDVQPPPSTEREAPALKGDATPAPAPKGDTTPAPTPRGDATPAPKGDTTPAPTPRGDATPAPTPKGDATPTPAPTPKGDATPTPAGDTTPTPPAYWPSAVEIRLCRVVVNDNTRNWLMEELLGWPDLYALVDVNVELRDGKIVSLPQKLPLPKVKDGDSRCFDAVLYSYDASVANTSPPIRIDLKLGFYFDHAGQRAAGRALQQVASQKGFTDLALQLAVPQIGIPLAITKLGFETVGAALANAGDELLDFAHKSYTRPGHELDHPWSAAVSWRTNDDARVYAEGVVNVQGLGGWGGTVCRGSSCAKGRAQKTAH